MANKGSDIEEKMIHLFRFLMLPRIDLSLWVIDNVLSAKYIRYNMADSGSFGRDVNIHLKKVMRY